MVLSYESYLAKTSRGSEVEYSYRRLFLVVIRSVTSTPHRIDSSIAFLNKPFLRLAKVDCRARSLVIGEMVILFLPIVVLMLLKLCNSCGLKYLPSQK